MSDDRWRTPPALGVVHPHDPAVLLARALLGAAGPFTPVAGPSWLPPELERLRDFHLPGDAAS